MILIQNWQIVLRKAWSLKFTGASIFFSAAEVYVQLFKPESIAGGTFAAIAGGVSLMAGFARLLAQREVPSATDK